MNIEIVLVVLIILGVVAAASFGGLLMVAWGLHCAGMRREKLPQELAEFWEEQLAMQEEQVNAIKRLASRLAGPDAASANDTPEVP